ncbi:ADP-heptose--LPS heptosyltransferase RfaF [Flavobacteriaceae bacterium R33]|uniref:ADP-heptose--LPS heptosyltransferase RfaF n=2 Tax=Poritiphilus flavus TaxID=2697053 RepID=A0A6L9E8Q7_9FLAO|nr:ADP-heptose--LPS heptosyltransferase RfaF [Poritiphilus flavus]
MTIPVLFGLTKQYPELRITVLTRAFFKPLFEALPACEVYEADVKKKHKGFAGLWKLYKELKSLDISMVADLHNVLRSNILKRFFSISRIPFVQIDKGRSEKGALTKGRMFEPLKNTWQRYSDVFEALGLPVPPERMDVLPKPDLAQEVANMVGDDHRKWLGIAPFAAFPGKMYPLQLMEEVIQTLDNTNKYKILLFGGGKQEVETLDKWASKYANTTSVAGKLNFSSELGLISRLDLMLSMDSGNGHLAAVYGVPVVTLWGVTHPYAGFAPFRQPPENALCADRTRFPRIPTSVYGNKLPKGYEKAMATILPQQVIDKVMATLADSTN